MLPEVVEPGSGTKGRWMVTIFDNPHTMRGEVVGILMRATRCNREEAEMETWEAESFGKAQVHFGELVECESAASLIGTIGVKTEVSAEWRD